MVELNDGDKVIMSMRKTYLVGFTYRMENFVPIITVYLQRSDAKLQIESRSFEPNELVVNVKEVKNFSIPFFDENTICYMPKEEKFEVFFNIFEAPELEYGLEKIASLGRDELFGCGAFALDIENAPVLILNEDVLKKVHIHELTKAIY